mgnify:CR=1 FL=1
MKIAILNDTHAGIRNSSDIFMDYQEKFYRDVFFPYLRENGITQILHLGDYYDNRKTVNFKALGHNRKIFLEKLREYGITMDIIPGNHDVYYKNTNELNALKELQGHYMNEVNLVMEPTVLDYEGLKMGLVPWICKENEEQCLDFIANCKADFIGGHFDIIGYEMMKGIKCDHGLDRNLFSRFEMVMSGHFHTKSNQDNIRSLGYDITGMEWEVKMDKVKYLDNNEMCAICFADFKKLMIKSRKLKFSSNTSVRSSDQIIMV